MTAPHNMPLVMRLVAAPPPQGHVQLLLHVGVLYFRQAWKMASVSPISRPIPLYFCGMRAELVVLFLLPFAVGCA